MSKSDKTFVALEQQPSAARDPSGSENVDNLTFQIDVG